MTITSISDVLYGVEPTQKAKWCVQVLSLTFWHLLAKEPDPSDPTKQVDVEHLQFGVTVYHGTTQLGFAHINGRSEAERTNLYRIQPNTIPTDCPSLYVRS